MISFCARITITYIDMKLNNSLLLLIEFFVIGALLSGCTLAKISGRGAVPLMMNNPPFEVDVIERVEETERIVFDQTGAIDASEVIGDKIAESDSDAMINVTLTLKSTPADFFINMLTFGLANSRTFVIEGELVRAPEGVRALLEEGTVLDEAPTLTELDASVADFQGHYLLSTMVVRTNQGFALIRYDLE